MNMNKIGFKEFKSGFKRLVLATLTLCFLSCSADHGGREGEKENEGGNIISGTVAMGAPVKGIVILMNASTADKPISCEIDKNGHYSLTLVDFLTGPYMLQAKGTVGGRIFCIHAMGTRADVSETVNITPLTDLVVGNIVEMDPETFYDANDYVALSKKATEENINKHEALVRARFATIFQLFDVNSFDFNLMNTPFNADHTGVDGVLDAIRIEPVSDESGNRLPQVKVKIPVTGDEITDYFDKENDTDALPVSNQDKLRQINTECIAIYNVFQSWVDLFKKPEETESETTTTKGVPTTDNVKLRALFSTDFFQNGYNLSGFLGKICVEGMEGMTFWGLTLDSIDLEAGKALVSFTVTDGDGFAEDQYGWELEKSGDTWLIKGNRQLIDCVVGTYAAYSETTGSIIYNGLCLYGWTPFLDATDGLDPRDVNQIIVQGPGITGEYVMSHEEKGGRILFVNADSSPQGYLKTDDPTVIKDNSEYVFYLRDLNGDTINTTGYKHILKRAHPGSDALLSNKASLFCDFTSPYQLNFNNYKGGGAMIPGDCIWKTPSRMIFKEINYVYIPANDTSQTINKRILLPDNPGTHYITINETINKIDIYLRSTDTYDRVYDTFFSQEAHKDEAKAYDVINYRPKTLFPYRIF